MQLLLYAANQTGTLSSQPRQRLQPITGVLHALGLVLESLAPWYEPGAAQQQTNQTLRVLTLSLPVRVDPPAGFLPRRRLPPTPKPNPHPLRPYSRPRA